MMSIERELLKRCLDRLDWRYSRPMVGLHDEIQELLAQPEPKREPLSDERLEFLVDKYHGYPKTLGRAIEKAHGIGVDDE